MVVKVILLSVGIECLLIAFCIHFSYGSWFELSSSLSVIGCSCLFISAILYFILNEDPSHNHKKSIHKNSYHIPLKSPSPYKLNTKSITPDSIKKHPTNNQQKSIQHPSKRAISSPSTSSPSLIPSPSTSLKHRLSPSKSPHKSTSKLLLNSNSTGNTQIISTNNNNNNDCKHQNDENVSKRSDYLEWTEYFLSVATLSSMRSKDPSTQVGACIVNEQKRIVGIGYNGFPTGCNDDKLPWNRKHSLGINYTKYPYVCHAELNAILNKNSATCYGCTMYVILFPCNECAKLIIQSGIKRIIYICDKYKTSDQVIASKKLLNMAGVEFKQYIPKKKSILITFPDASQ